MSSSDHTSAPRKKFTGSIFFGLGAILAWGFVAHGVAAVWSVPMLAAALVGSITVGIQLLILFDGKKYGWKIGSWLFLLYAAFTLLNVVLAAAGVSASLLKDQLGKESVTKELAVAQNQIKSVAESLDSVVGEARLVAEVSAQKKTSERNVGGSCNAPGTGPSPKGPGPIAEMRNADQLLFSTLAADADSLAQEMRTSNSIVEQTLSSYDADKHAGAITAINAALNKARSSALVSQSIKSRAATRLSQWQSGQPVLCHDPELLIRIQALVDVNYPIVGEVGRLPDAPTPNSAARALVSDVASSITDGAPFSWEIWGAPIFGGLLPDVLLVLGYCMWMHDRDRRSFIVHEVTFESLGSESTWTDLMNAASEGLIDEGLAGLARYHSRKTAWYGDTDALTIPHTAAAQPFLLMAKSLMKRGYARYQGMAQAAALPPEMSPRPDVAPDQLSHFFVLKDGIWNQILADALRMASLGRAAAR